MKLVLLSDTHDQRPVVPEGDILVVAGDVFCGDDIASLRREIRWFEGLEFRHVVMVLGNHDLSAQHNPGVLASSKKIHLLANSSVEIEGVTFYGVRWKTTPSIPAGTDVVISHEPCHGILDAGIGSPVLRRAVLAAHPRLFVSGHVHGARGHVVHNGIDFFNATLDAPTKNVIGAMSHTAKQSPNEQPWVHELEVRK